jgi:hypothetical protein
MPVDMSKLKDFRCILTVPKGVLSGSCTRTAPCKLCKVLNVCGSYIVLLLQIDQVC